MELTKTQNKQLNFLSGYQGLESLSKLNLWDCYCFTCKEGIQVHAACSCIDFVNMHKGHRTWIKLLGKGLDPLAFKKGEVR